MSDIIKIEEKIFNNQSIQTVNARELHEKLENKRQFTDWIKQRIEKYDFVENQDYIIISQNCETIRNYENTTRKGVSVSTEYFVSLDTAKELCMVENNEKGKLIRKYFIECEKKLKQLAPTNLKDALLLAYQQQCKIEEQQQLIEQQQPKVEFYDKVIDSKDWIDMGQVAKVLNERIGRTKLFEFLRNNKILDKKNNPYQQYQDKGYFRLIETSYNLPNGDCKIYLKTLVSQKGLDFIRKKLKNRLTNKI
ncbi:phage antirepressor KilAC domain-containing protein [uncultured Clostridium sp.]|uniref:phage antirepressor KilAC domain-containing protein n=1 Tax=uncultured Clostridium sp. TaxID=59620 RepID=UPI0025FB39DE|nr:phage antirepressor KilAC domain-containing protein [uncultured Clostridium sp.]